MAIRLEEKDFINLYSLTPEQNAAYINLFITGLGSIPNGVIGLFFLRNINAINLIIEKLREKNDSLKFIVYDLDYVIESLKDCEIENIELMSIKEKRLEELGKFDHIIMNPPYSGSLHLKILREAMAHSDDIVNLSPIRWLQDPLAEYKKNSDWNKFSDIRKRVSSLDAISAKEANKIFGIALFSDLGISHLSKNGGFDFTDYWKTSRTTAEVIMIEKLISLKDNLKSHLEMNKVDGIRVPLTLIGGNRGYKPIYKDIIYTVDGKCDGKDWTKCKNMGGYEKEEGSPLPVSVKFATVQEAENFYNSYTTHFMSWICDISHQQQHLQETLLPFLPDYTHPWTDDMLYKYFGLTDDEIKTIENEVE